MNQSVHIETVVSLTQRTAVCVGGCMCVGVCGGGACVWVCVGGVHVCGGSACVVCTCGFPDPAAARLYPTQLTVLF